MRITASYRPLALGTLIAEIIDAERVILARSPALPRTDCIPTGKHKIIVFLLQTKDGMQSLLLPAAVVPYKQNKSHKTQKPNNTSFDNI